MAPSNHESFKDQMRQLPSLTGNLSKVDFVSFPDTPQEAFKIWIAEAIEAGIQEPHAMTLSTVDEQQRPDARVLILKNLDDRGWHFAARANGPKGHQIASNKSVSLSFYWKELGRQVRIRGEAIPLPDDECAQDFADRPSGSKVAAIGSTQSQVLESNNQLQEAMESARNFVEEQPGYVPSDWMVYAVQPNEVEFWQGSKDRLHQRLQYVVRKDQTWMRQELWP